MMPVMTRNSQHHNAADNSPPARAPERDWVQAFFARANPGAEFDACSALAQAAARALQVSLTLASAGRAIDLTGLDNWIGRLTASAVDLDPVEGRRMRPALASLLRNLDVLEGQISPSSPPHSHRSEKFRADT
jgi:hypothetical protein